MHKWSIFEIEGASDVRNFATWIILSKSCSLKFHSRRLFNEVMLSALKVDSEESYSSMLLRLAYQFRTQLRNLQDVILRILILIRTSSIRMLSEEASQFTIMGWPSKISPLYFTLHNFDLNDANFIYYWWKMIKKNYQKLSIMRGHSLLY